MGNVRKALIGNANRSKCTGCPQYCPRRQGTNWPAPSDGQNAVNPGKTLSGSKRGPPAPRSTVSACDVLGAERERAITLFQAATLPIAVTTRSIQHEPPIFSVELMPSKPLLLARPACGLLDDLTYVPGNTQARSLGGTAQQCVAAIRRGPAPASVESRSRSTSRRNSCAKRTCHARSPRRCTRTVSIRRCSNSSSQKFG